MMSFRFAAGVRAVFAAVAILALVVGPAPADTTRAVVFVANAEDGTVGVIDAQTHQTLRTIDVIPD